MNVITTRKEVESRGNAADTDFISKNCLPQTAGALEICRKREVLSRVPGDGGKRTTALG